MPAVREATLDPLDPVPTAVLDLPLFVGACARAVVGLRWAAWTAAEAAGACSAGRLLHNIS
ncbi:hypothetical protein EDF54_0121 [Rathayibacter sp. PhB93]|uniref:hypothetical protein n=1 Tax=unclassified Rathayibacter TaxID=2609250 RepID=UPI000F463484|nr:MULTISPECIES: hypothetical protein [unclassified Rathayibacter]ROQ16999.1 hypothetical protein EDF54_0121 [Rathayibacter sp. PhB93]TDQ06785.1 hypothetical protein EDF17_3779 [Rathayibacter sp. PhB1]